MSNRRALHKVARLFSVAMLLWLSIVTMAAGDIASVLLPLLRWEMTWLAPQYHLMDLRLAHTGLETTILAQVETYGIRVIGARLIPNGIPLESSTLVGHALLTPALMLALLTTAGIIQREHRAVLAALALPAILVMVMADVPFVLVGALEDVVIASAQPLLPVHSGWVMWMNFLNGGGRIALGIGLALLAIPPARVITAICRPTCSTRISRERNEYPLAMNKSVWIALSVVLLLFVMPGAAAGAPADKAHPHLIERVQRNEPVNVIVELESGAVENEAAAQRKARGLPHDDVVILDFKSQQYRQMKDRLYAALLPRRQLLRRDYEHLPMFAARINTPADLDALLQRPEVAAIYEDIPLQMHLSQSAPLVRRPQAATLNQSGVGTTVAVLDTGVNYLLSDFGGCSAPGVPIGCKVVYAQDFAPDDGARDDSGHGSNVAGIVLGVAPDSRIAALDVFNGTSANATDIIAAMNWSIANQATYNIVAINMSLGGGLYSSPCTATGLNPFRTPIINARSAGMVTVASSGNDASTNSIGMPACTPEAVSVGAVYDANVGGIGYGFCTDSTTAADKVACFSNSASFLTLLAPGALITAAGSTKAGTSQAAPHASGAVAVLQSAYPADAPADTFLRLTSNGVTVTDSRNGLAKPRLDVLAALGAINDDFAAAVVLTGTTGTVYGANHDAGKEVGEPDHAGDVGGKSLWWQWSAPFSGPVDLSTAGSNFDTTLAVYTGATLSGLVSVAANDNDFPAATSAISFTAQAGAVYRIAVDGHAAASGTISLNWNYVDSDGDGIIDALDNCAALSNGDQSNFDGDPQGDACDPDDDNDGMPDTWETAHGLDPFDFTDAAGDIDGDLVSNLDEFLAGTDPTVADVVEAEVPLLPPWAMAIFAGLLSVIGGLRAGRR